MQKLLVIGLFLLLIVGCSPSEKKDINLNKERLSEKYEGLTWFNEARFGLFIHWGLYAIPAGEYNGRKIDGIGEWIMQRAPIPVKEYEKFASQFNPTKFNADEWSQLAKDAGMKYIVITAKHHDGFAMYPSKVSDYNITNRTPFKRDPLKELAVAAEKKDIALCFYYSQALDWHEPNGVGNNWDFPEERDIQKYIDSKAIPQMEELLSNYGNLGLIWYDYPAKLTIEQSLAFKQKVKEIQPQCLVNNRVGNDLGDYYVTGDNAIPTMVYDWKPWEVPATLNDTWGFKTDDTHWKNPDNLIYKLTDIVSKGGNYLLNVGPTAEGLIPVESQNILRTIGKWLDVNDEAIFGTKHTPFFYKNNIWKCTAKDNHLYFHIINWPEKELLIPGLESKVKKAWFLANNDAVAFQQSNNVLTLNLPQNPIDKHNTIIAVEIADKQAKVSKGYGYRDPQQKINLYVIDASHHRGVLKYNKETQTLSGLMNAKEYWTDIKWYHYAFEDGNYRVEVEYSCENQIAGSAFYFRNHRDNYEDQTFTGTIKGTDGKLGIFPIGEITFTKGIENRMHFGLNDDKSANLRLKKLIITKVE